jgi:hypothetical protein
MTALGQQMEHTQKHNRTLLVLIHFHLCENSILLLEDVWREEISCKMESVFYASSVIAQ